MKTFSPRQFRHERKSLVLASELLLIVALLSLPAAAASLKFSAGSSNEFTFDTGTLKGNLRAEGKSKGLTSVVHLPTGLRLDRSMGLFGHYRVFTANHRFGTAAWDWPSEAKLGTDGSVQVRWPATAERPFELGAVYRWATPNTLDLETTVQAKTNLAKFESFLASYFAESFTNASVYIQKDGASTFMRAQQSAGLWLAFPRDEPAASIIKDGRWTSPPSPVDWVIMPPLHKPLAIRRAGPPGLSAVIMGRPQDCFAVLCPHETETHYSMYLSLFGRDLKPGETARGQCRLVIAPDLTDAQAPNLYNRFEMDSAR